MRSSRDKKDSATTKYIPATSKYGNAENATFTMGRFFPVSTVTVRNSHSNGSGFVDIANNSKADEEMTSNDTVLVSNETETDIFANETTPQYVLMSQPLLTLNDSRSVLGGKSTLVHTENSLSVMKTVLLSRSVKSVKPQTLSTLARTSVVDPSELFSVKVESMEGLKPPKLLSNDVSQTFNMEAAETVWQTLKTSDAQLQSATLQVLSTADFRDSQVVLKSSVQVNGVVTNDLFKPKTSNVQTASIAHESSFLHTRASFAATSQDSEQMQTSQAETSSLETSEISVKPQTLSTLARTSVVDPSELFSVKVESMEGLKPPKLPSNDVSQTFNMEARETVWQTLKPSDAQLQSVTLQVLSTAAFRDAQVVLKSSVQVDEVVTNDFFKPKTSNVQTVSIDHESSFLHTHASFAATSQNSGQMQTSQAETSSLEISDFSPPAVSDLISPLNTPGTAQSLSPPSSNGLGTLSSLSASSLLNKRGLGSSSFETSSIRKISGSEHVPHTVLSISSEIPETTGIFSSVVVLDDKENQVILSSEILEQFESTSNASWASFSLSADVASPTNFLLRSTVDSLPLSRLETPTIAQSKTENYLQSFSLVTGVVQPELQTLEKIERFDPQSVISTTPEVESSINNYSRPSSSLIFTQGNKTVAATATIISRSEEPSGSADLLDQPNLTARVDLTSPSVPGGFSQQNYSVYQRRTFSFVLPTPSATVQVSPEEPVHNKASSSLGNTQSTRSAALQEERDEIPAATPRLLRRPFLSDVSSSDIHSLTSFVNTNSPEVFNESNEKSNDNLISAKPRIFVSVALTSPPLNREPEAGSSEKTHSTTSMMFSSPELPKSAQIVTKVTFEGPSSINPLIEADGDSLEAGSGENASLVVEVQGTRGIDEADRLSQSTQKVSSFIQEVDLTVVVASSSSSLVPSQFSRATLVPSLQQGAANNITAVKTSILLTHVVHKNYSVELSATEKNITNMSTTEGKQDGTRNISQQGIPAEVSVIHQGPVWSSSDVSRNQSSRISKSTETNNISSSGVLRKQYLTTLPLLGLPIQTQISSDIIAASRTLSITRSLEVLKPEETSSSISSLYKRKTIPDSTVLKTSSEPSQQQMISLAGSPGQRLSGIYSRQTATLSLSYSRPANISSSKFHSRLVSFGSTATENIIAHPATTPSQASEKLLATGEIKLSHDHKRINEIKMGQASVLLVTPFLPHSVKTEHIRKFTKATPSEIHHKSSRKFETKSLAIASTSILERLEDTVVKLHGKEKVVRTLASGIVASPVFHHAIRHIGELLKNESGLVHSFSRIESMLGHLQNLLARETRNHVRNLANFSLPLVDTVQKGNSSEEISKQVDSKLDGISTKLKRITSVLTELQIKKRENNSTIIEKSNIERPGNFTTVDERHNRLIELLLKRFSKLEAAIQRKRDFSSFNTLKTESLVSVHKNTNINASVLQYRSSKGSRSIVKSKQEASTKVSSSNVATRRSANPVTSQKGQISMNALLGSKAIIVHHSPISTKSTISISPAKYMTEPSVSRFTTNGLNLDLFEEPQISPSSVDSYTLLVSSPPPRKLMTSHDSLMLPTEVTNRRKSASSSVRAKPSVRTVENNANVSSTVLKPSVSTSSLRIASTVVGVPQSVSNHHTYNKTHHVERSEEFTFVTFRSGMEAGVFTDRGKVNNMESCVERCYNHPSCHVAFMVAHNCYSIHCYSQKTCEILPVQSPIISTRVVYLKDRMLRLPYNTTTQPKASSLVTDDGNFTIKNCAKNVTVLKNMTFLAGMSAGNYTDYGTVDSIQACSNICCSKKVCDAAFMILNNCFTIDCISDKACHAIPSKSHKVNTSIVYFRKTLSTVRFQQMGVPEVKSQPLCPLLGGVLKGVTFNGGIRAGYFTDHGYAHKFSSCIEKCCSSQTCDVAFMVKKNCYSVKCATNMRRCLPVVARSTKFKTFMAVKKTGHFLKFTIPAGSNSTCTQSGPIQHDFTFRRGIKAGNFTGRGLVKDMDSCIHKCCSSSSCSAAFMIGKHCYSVTCRSPKDCETVLAKKTNFMTSVAFIKRERGDDKSDKIKSNQRTTFTRSILGGHCDATDVQHNVNITGGWRAGKFLRISDIKDMTKCTEACCDYHGCGAAMFIDKYCYNLICFKQRGCQLIGSKEAFMIDKFVAVRKNLGHVLSPFKKAQIATLTASTEHMNHSSFKQEVRKANKIRNRSTIFNLKKPDNTRISDDLHKLSRSVMESLSIYPTRTRFSTKTEGIDKTNFNLNAKKHEIPFYISSHLKERSLTPSLFRAAYSHIKSTVASLHDIPSIGVGQTSYISVTKQLTNVQDKTQSVDTFKISNSKTLSSSIKEPVIFKPPSSTSKEGTLPRQSLGLDTPVATSNNHTEQGSVSSPSSVISEDGINVTAVPPEGYSFKSDYSLLKGKTNHKTKRTYACTHTFVFNNATLRGGLKAGDVKNEGRVEGMEECVEMCCKTPECNVALLLKENCHIVACFNKESCEAVPAKQMRGRTKVAYVARSKDETELIKQLISHRETSKTNASSVNKTKSSKPTVNKDLQSADVAIRQGSCFRSPILRDVRFKLGRHAGDFKSVGIVRSVGRCVALCCKERACNAIFMLGSRCHLISCSNEQDCQTVEAKSKFYKPTVVYLARSKVEVAYFFKLIPKEVLGKYQNNATVAVNGSTDEDESAIRRSQLERPERNISVGLSYSQRSSANVTAASKRPNVLTSLQDVTPPLGSLSVSVSHQPTLQSSNILSTPKTMKAVLNSVSLQDVTPSLGSLSVSVSHQPTLQSSNILSTPKTMKAVLNSVSLQDVTPSLGGLSVSVSHQPTLQSSNILSTPKTMKAVLNSVRLQDVTPSLGSLSVSVSHQPTLQSSNIHSTPKTMKAVLNSVSLQDVTPLLGSLSVSVSHQPTLQSSNILSTPKTMKAVLNSASLQDVTPSLGSLSVSVAHQPTLQSSNILFTPKTMKAVLNSVRLQDVTPSLGSLSISVAHQPTLQSSNILSTPKTMKAVLNSVSVTATVGAIPRLHSSIAASAMKIVTPLPSLEATANFKPTREFSITYAIPQEPSPSFSNFSVTHTLTTSTRLTTPNIFASLQDHRKSPYQHGIATSNANAKSVTTSHLNPVLLSNVTKMSLKPLPITNIDRRRNQSSESTTNTRSGLSAKHYSSQEITLEEKLTMANTTATPTPRVKSSIEAQLKIVVTDITKSTATVIKLRESITRVTESPIKSSEAQVEASKVRSSAKLTPKMSSLPGTFKRSRSDEATAIAIATAHAAKKDDVNMMITKVAMMSSTNPRVSFDFASNYDHSTSNVATSHLTLALARTEFETFPASLARDMSRVSLLQSGSRTLTAAHQQNGNINKSWRHIAQADSKTTVITSDVPSGELHANSSISIISHRNTFSDVTSIENKTPNVESTRWHFISEHKRGDIPIVKTPAFQKSHWILSHSLILSSFVFQINATAGTGKQQLMTVTKPKLENPKNVFRSSLLPISSNSENKSTAQTLLLGTSDSKGMMMTRSKLNGPHFIQPSPTTSRGSSSTSELLLKASPSTGLRVRSISTSTAPLLTSSEVLISSISIQRAITHVISPSLGAAEVHRTSTRHTLEITRTYSASKPSSAQRVNVTTISTLPALAIRHTRPPLPASSIQSVLPKTSRLSFTLSTSLHPSNVVTAVMPTTAPGSKLLKRTNSVNDPPLILTAPHVSHTLTSPTVSRVSTISYTLEGLRGTKVELSSSAETKPPSSTTKNNVLSSTTRTIPLPTSSFKLSSKAPSKLMVLSREIVKTSSSLPPHLSMTTNASKKLSIASASLPRNVSSSTHSHIDDSAVNSSSRGEFVSKETLHLSYSASQSLRHSKLIKTSFEMNRRVAMPPGNQTQTSSPLLKANDLLQSLQGFISNMASKEQAIPRNGRTRDPEKQNISHDSYETHQIDEIFKTLRSNFPNIPKTKAQSVLMLVSKTSRNTSDFMSAKSLLNDNQNILSHREALLHSTPHSAARTTTQRYSPLSVPDEESLNFSSATIKDVPGRTKSDVPGPSNGISSKATANHRSVSIPFPPSVHKVGNASSQLSHFPSTVKIQHSSSVELQKRVEIPFAGRLLEQIKVLQYSSALKHRHIPTDLTPIAGGLLQQIKPLHTSPWQPLHTISANLPQMSGDRASLITKPLASSSYIGVADKNIQDKATSVEHLKLTNEPLRIISSSSQGLLISTSVTEQSSKYARAGDIQSKSPNRVTEVSRSKTSFTSQTASPSPKRDLGRPSPVRRTGPVTVITAIPSVMVKPLEIVHSKISTPVLTNTPAPKRLQSHPLLQGSRTLVEETSQTIKGTLDQSSTIPFPSTKSDSTEKPWHNEKNSMFGYFAKLLKSIKDILTKKNSRPDRESSATPLWSGPTSSYQNVTKATPFSSSVSSALVMPIITPQQQSVVRSMVSSITPTKASSLQLLTSKVFDISLAMQPLHQVAFNVTGIRQAALCEHSPSHENSTMRGGVRSGIFKEVAMVNNDAECISQCCISKTCDAAFLLSNRCFLVTCKNKMLCKSVPAKNVEFKPRVIYIENRMALAKGERNRESLKHSQFDINPVNISPIARFEASITSYQFSRSVKPGTNLNTTRIKNHSGKAVCRASRIQQNVTLQGGIQSGNFKDQGTVDNMQKCIDLCCSIPNCSVAFMLLSRCFSVSCYNQTSCNSIPARSLIFQPQLAYIRRNVTSKSIVDNHFAKVANSKTQTSVMAFSSSSELGRTESKKSSPRFPDNCRYSKSEKNVTLRGGLNAGTFLDTGVVDNITECVDNCCQATKCDVAFMIVKRCFLVTCYSSSLCQSTPTRNSGYFTEIVRIARDEIATVRNLLARLVQPSSPPAKMKSVFSSSEAPSAFNLPNSHDSLFLNSTTSGSISKLLTSTSHFTGFHSRSSLPSRPPAVPALRAVIESAIAPLNVNKQGIFGLIQTIGMSTRPVSARHALDQIITPSSLKLNSPSSSILQWPESVGDESIQEKQVETVEFSKDETCQSTAVFYNATMRGGINAGVFKDQGTVQNMRKCIEQCCRWQFCSVAFMLLTRCYIIACYNDHLCDPVPARNVTFTPRVAFVSRVQRDHGNLSSILENIPTPSLSVYQKSHLKTSTGGTNFTTTAVYSKRTLFPSTSTNAASQLPSSLAIKPSPSQSSFSKVFSSRPVWRHHCTNSEQKHNVTLRGGLSAGHFKDRGKVVDMQKCVDFCCKEDHCDVALMLLENCFTVICHNKRLCESVPAKTGRYKSRIVYVWKSRNHKSTQLLKHKLPKTVSLLDAALPAMGEYNESEIIQAETTTTVFERSILKVEKLNSTEHSRNQSQTNKDHHGLIHQEKLHTSAKSKQMNATASQHKQHHLMSTSVSLGHNTSLLFSSTIRLNASVWALPEPGKSAIERGAKSGHESGLTSTFMNPSQHSFPQPSSCLSSPISYNVTLRNGIRSGYFRDQGRVENMGACIQKCCDAEDCDVAFLLKQRCYLVTCYTKKGCETVPARHSLFRPRVSHVQRANVSQLMSFMDEQDNAYSSGKTASVQSRSSNRTHFITPSSTLPAPVNSLNSSSIHNTKSKTSPTHKAQASPVHHMGKKHHNTNTGKKKQRSGNLATQKRSEHVTVAPELKKRKSMKLKKRRRVRHKHKPKEAKSESSRIEMQHFELTMVKKKDQKLSHSDLSQLFHLMKPKKRVNNAHSMSDGGPHDKNSDSLKKTIKPETITRKDGAIPPSPSASKQDNYRTAVTTGYDHRFSKKKMEAPRLHRKSSASPHNGASKMRTRPNLAATKPHSRVHKSQTILTLEKEGNKKKFNPTKKVKFGRKTTTKQKATHMTAKEFLDLVTSRLTTPTGTRSRLNTARQPTVMPPKVSSHRGSKSRETKSTVPSLPTQVPDLEVSSCATGPVEYNQTLRGGLSSGLFHEVGKVRDIRGCSRHCCSSPICDLAFMVLSHCFLVTCSSSNPHMCDSTPALATNFNPMISRVSRSGSEDNKGKPTAAPVRSNKLTPTVKPLATPPKLPRKPEKVLVPASNVTNNSTAGNQAYPTTSPGNSSRRHPDVKEGGEISVSASELLPSPPGCISSSTEHNATLRGGLHAGKFTDAGKVDGSYTCTELCCKADNCDVAFFAFHRCFLVNCFDEYLCTSTPSLLPNFNPTLVHVYRHRSKPTPKPSTTLPPINYVLQQIEDETKTKSKSKNKTCAHSEVYEEVTLRKGYKAGKFTSHGKVNSSDQCVDFCCGRPRCDLIFMFLNNCFTVSCSSGVACEIVSARQSKFKPRVVYLIKNNSTKLIKPSELNSSLSDPTSFVGKQPVNAVHYKELRSDKNNRDSYKKDFSQMNNDSETIDEEFTEVPDNKITSRTVINSAGNANSHLLKYNVSEHIVGKKPVDTLHNKVLRSSNRNQESYKKNFTQMNNDTETVDEEFTQVSGNKITSRIAINSAVNASSQLQKHNVSNNLIAKSDIETTKQKIKDRHKVKLKSSEMTNHKESKTEEKMDLVLNKLTSVTEENKRLEGEFHVLMSKQNKRRHKSKIASSVSARGEKRKAKSKSSKNIEKKRIKYKDRRRMSRLGFSNGSGMESSASKRVVIVDTDRPPVFPPTDEHNIEEHSIHASQRKTHQKEHLRKSGKPTPKQRPLKKQHDSTGTRLKHWDPTNEHYIEEHAIYSTKDVSESRSESKKTPHVNAEEGSEVKYGQPEGDTDDIEFNEMLNLKSNNKHASKPEEPVWISSNDENKDDRESFHENISPTPKSHFQSNDHTNKEHSSEDEFHIEHQDKSEVADKNVWMNTRNNDIDHKESFQDQIAPTLKSHFQLDNQKGLEHNSEEEFHIQKQDDSTSSVKHVWMSSRNKHKDRLENSDEQIAPTHITHFQLDKQKEKMREDEFDIDGSRKSKDSENRVWVSSRDRNEDHLGSFHDEIAPTHKSNFQFETQKNKNSREEEPRKEQQDESDVSEGHVWKSTRNRNEDRLKSFHDQIAPTYKSNFQFENQKNTNSREEKPHKEQQDESDVSEGHVWKSTRNRNEDRLKSFHDQIAPTYKSNFQFENQKNKNSREEKPHKEQQDESDVSEGHVWKSTRNRNEDRLKSFHDQIAPTYKSNFQFENQKNKNSREEKPHKEQQDESDVSEGHVWKSTRNRNEDRLKSFHDQIAPTHRSHFRLDKQRENQSTKEDDFHIATHYGQEEPERHIWIGSTNKNEVASTSHFQLDESGDNYDSKEGDFHFEDQVEPQVSEKHEWEILRNRSKDHTETENIPEQTSPSQTSRFQLNNQWNNQWKDKHINRDEFHIKQPYKPSVHEVAGGEPRNRHDNVREEKVLQNVSKKPEIHFTMSNSSETALSEFAESGKNIGTSQAGHGVEGPVFAKKHFGKEHKGVPHDNTEGSNTKSSMEMALTEKPLPISPSVTEHSGNGHETLIPPHRKQGNNSHEKPDFDVIYNKINTIYNRLQNLFDAQTRRERNTTLSSSKTQGRLDKLSKNSKKREEDIPTPPVSSLRPTARPSSITPPTNRVRVVKQFVTDDYRGAGVPPHRHRDALMDYIKTIYKRVQELYKRKLNNPRHRVLANHKRRKFHHILASGEDAKQRKTSKGRHRPKKAKNYHRKKVEEEAVLKEMKRIYKSMKEMYHQQRKAQKKAEILAKTSEEQHQRSYIPSRYDTRESDDRTSLHVSSARPTRPGRTLNRPSPLTSSTAGAGVKPQVHKTGKHPSCIVWFESQTIKCERNAWLLRQVATSNKFI